MQKGKVFTLDGDVTEDTDELIRGTSLLNDIPCQVLFNCGATHSFISVACAKRLNLSPVEMPYKLAVSTPTSASVTTSLVCLYF
ncbi:MAG: hypothetical protein Q8877_03420 [Sweet potato little leaf phytoplasma]|nr:hypothetical protein [Sweet potato little leaf phytoplasma]